MHDDADENAIDISIISDILDVFSFDGASNYALLLKYNGSFAVSQSDVMI